MYKNNTDLLGKLEIIFGHIISTPTDLQNVSELIDIYRCSSPNQRELIRSRIKGKITVALFHYSHIAAVECVRKESVELLFNAILAQIIEDGRFDERDTIVILFLLYNSAKHIGEDFFALGQKVVEFSSTHFRVLLLSFLNRTDINDDLCKLAGYKVITEPDFNYVRCNFDEINQQTKRTN